MLEVMLQVTQPYHGPGGELLYEPGQRFPQDAELPPDLRTAPVVAEAPDPEPAQDVPAKAPAAKSAKATAD